MILATERELCDLQPKFVEELTDDVLLSFKERLIAVAQSNLLCVQKYIYCFILAETSTQSPDTLLTDSAKYFVYKNQASVADNLKDYISSTTQPLSIILGKIMHLHI